MKVLKQASEKNSWTWKGKVTVERIKLRTLQYGIHRDSTNDVSDCINVLVRKQ
jgi:hypothetical protein